MMKYTSSVSSKRTESGRSKFSFKIDILIPGTDISAISSRVLQTGVAVPSSYNAS
jgi:hypothetical protein